MDTFITELFSSEAGKRKTRSSASEVDETYATQSMMSAMFGNMSEEFAELLHNMDDQHKNKVKDLMDLHVAEKERWIKEKDELVNRIDNNSQYARRDNIKIVGV